MTQEEAEATIRPNGQTLAVLWDLLPPAHWAESHGLHVVLILNEEVGGIQALRESGELACAILPPKAPATAPVFRFQAGKANDPIWSRP